VRACVGLEMGFAEVGFGTCRADEGALRGNQIKLDYISGKLEGDERFLSGNIGVLIV
jgi:hypothetical protein